MRNFLSITLLSILLLASCKVPKDIVFVQDMSDLSVTGKYEVGAIVARPEDKIRIVVNSHDRSVSSIFNLHSEHKYSSSYQQDMLYYTVDPNGSIQFPVLGDIQVGGLTRVQIADSIQTKLTAIDMIKDPVVLVEFVNLSYSILGEVNNPGRFKIDKDHVTLLDAISAAGDLKITGQRENVKIMREDDGKVTTYTVDLTDGESLLHSPAYHIQQNDVIYIEPNNKSKRMATQNGNTVTSTSFWTSLISLAITVCLFLKQL